ncbi:MAG: energy-coupling factor transporter ATPase [Clostridiales bacterium]|jgi:energy-coupling factor transport system ATP-binding protein|nr:energy-coupling factor transporter ATPase [Clostridiales bacterium]
MHENIIEIKNAAFFYDSETANAEAVIKNISLSVKRGSFVAVLGHNGSGKSTLAKLCNAILVPQEGKVFVNGMDTSDSSLTFEIRRAVGMVFQNPDNQIVATVVEDDVAFGPENLGVEPKEIRRRVDSALRSVGMYDFRGFPPHNLSGGQKQRVAIAGIIAMRTECIVLDEPTAMLDPKGRVEVMKTVKSLNRELGITVVFITHFMDEAAQADRIIVMDDGGIILDGTPKEVFSNKDTLRESGLDVPVAAEFADMLISEGIDLPKGILTADECVEAVADAAKKRGLI